MKLEVGQVKSESHLPNGQVKCHPNGLQYLYQLNVWGTVECSGQIYLMVGQAKFGRDMPEVQVVENP